MKARTWLRAGENEDLTYRNKKNPERGDLKAHMYI